MKKFFLVIFILVDLAVIAGSALFLAAKLGYEKTPALVNSLVSGIGVPVVAPTLSPAKVTEDVPAISSGEVTSKYGTATATSRKILFTYRSSRPKKVMIRADFTGWRAEAMEKDATTHTWKYMAILEPGEYSYLFSVDDKPAKDPANRRTKKVGTTVVSSLVVGPPTSPVQ